MTGKLLAIHGFMPKRVCRGREKSWEKERRLVNLGCREADLARGEDRGKQRAEVNRYERAIFIKKIAQNIFGTIIFTNFE